MSIHDTDVAGPIEHMARTVDNSSDVHKQLRGYDERLDTFRDIVGVLEDRLSVILADDSPMENKPMTAMTPNRSSLAGIIGDMNERLSNTTDRLRRITERIDL